MTSKVYVAVRVPADPQRAFDAFTDDIAAWWRPNGLFRITERGDGRLAFEPGQSTEVEVRFEAVGDDTRISVEHRAWDTIPRRHAARHGFPEHATLERCSDWWRASLFALQARL